MIPWIQHRWPALRFTLIFAALMVLFYALSAGLTYDRWLAVYLHESAIWTSHLLNLFGQHTIVSGLTLESQRFAFTVQRGCDAVEPTWFYLTAVLAFPSRWLHKFGGMLLGALILNLLNLLRIASLFLLGSYAPAHFNFVHLEIWPVIFILLSILLWVGWIKTATSRTSN